MKELKEIFNFIKEKYQNPKTRAAVILGIYLVFFVFLAIAFRTPNDTSNNKNEQVENYININTNYSYTYNVEIKKEDKIDKYLFTGYKNTDDSKEKIELYNINTETYEEIFDYEDVNPKFIDLGTVISYVNNIKEEFSTNYKDGTIQKNFLVELNTIDSNVNSNETVEINVYENDGFITKIIIDGTNFDSKTNKDITYSKYNLEFNTLNEEQNTEE